VNRRHPVKVETPQRFRSLSAGPWETCALTMEGAVVCWGGAFPGTLPHSVLGDQRTKLCLPFVVCLSSLLSLQLLHLVGSTLVAAFCSPRYHR